MSSVVTVSHAPTIEKVMFGCQAEKGPRHVIVKVTIISKPEVLQNIEDLRMH